MKVAIAAVVIAFCTTSSCSKNEEPSPISSQTWKVSNQVFSRNAASWHKKKIFDSDDSLSVIAFSDDTDYRIANSLWLTFTQKPEKDKLYRIVYDQPENEHQVSIYFDGATSPRGGSQNEPEQYLNVTKEGATLRFVGTDLTVQKYTFVVDNNTTLSLNVSQ